MKRRGSNSAKMLQPAVAAVQGQQLQLDQRQHPHQPGDGAVRRSSALSFTQGMTNGGFGAGPRPPPQDPVTQASGAAPPSTGMQWQHTSSVGHPTHTAAHRHHSFSSSMDLMTTAAPARPLGGASAAFQSHLFKSSSHHTSHTAAAGDLLTMSRRALDPAVPNPAGGGARKRSSGVFGDNGSNPGRMGFGGMNQTTWGMNQTSSQPAGQLQQPQHSNFGQPPHPHHLQQNAHAMGQPGGLFPNGNRPDKGQLNPQTTPAVRTYVSSSTVGSDGEHDDSHRHRRNVRRCRRSDSFEMMEDA